MFGGQQDGLDADLPAAAHDGSSLEGGLKLRLDSETQPADSLHLRLDSEAHASGDVQLPPGSETQPSGALQLCPGSAEQGDRPVADEPPGSRGEAAQEEAAHDGEDENMGPAGSEEAGTQSGEDADAEGSGAGACLEDPIPTRLEEIGKNSPVLHQPHSTPL